MKKLSSIILVVLLLFNVLGYYGLFLGLRFKTTQDLMQRLDDNAYSSSETVTLKIPMAVPYPVTTAEYVRVNGEIEHEGEFYRLVKQKLSNDTLYVVCIKDSKSKDIKHALANYVKTFSDKPLHTGQGTKELPGFIKDYLPVSIEVTHLTQGWYYSVRLRQQSDLLRHFNPSIPSPPPKV